MPENNKSFCLPVGRAVADSLRDQGRDTGHAWVDDNWLNDDSRDDDNSANDNNANDWDRADDQSWPR